MKMKIFQTETLLKYHAAHITCRGYDYFEESTLEEGEMVAKEKLFNKLKELGHIVETPV